MDEIEIYEALGLTPPEESGNEPEVAEPAEEETEAVEVEETEAEEEEGENESDVAEPAEEETEEQTKEERSRQAAARRKREQEQAIRDAVKAALAKDRAEREAQMKRVFEWAGWQDSEGKAIDSVEALTAYMDRQEEEKLQKDLKAGRVSREQLQKLIAGELAKAAPKVPERDETAKAEEFRQRVDAELEEIRKYDPSVQSVADFRKLDRAEEFFNEVRQHGHSFLDAYKFVYADKIAEAKATAAAKAGKQQAMNNARSKDHLKVINARGAGDAAVPADVMAQYKIMMPHASADEIRQHYNKYARN